MHPYGMQDGQSLNAGFVQAEIILSPAATARRAGPIAITRLNGKAGSTPPKVAESHGMELDTNFYTWGPAVMYPNGNQAHGYITGSGLPMQFVDENGDADPRCTSRSRR